MDFDDLDEEEEVRREEDEALAAIERAKAEAARQEAERLEREERARKLQATLGVGSRARLAKRREEEVKAAKQRALEEKVKKTVPSADVIRSRLDEIEARHHQELSQPTLQDRVKKLQRSFKETEEEKEADIEILAFDDLLKQVDEDAIADKEAEEAKRAFEDLGRVEGQIVPFRRGPPARVLTQGKEMPKTFDTILTRLAEVEPDRDWEQYMGEYDTVTRDIPFQAPDASQRRLAEEKREKMMLKDRAARDRRDERLKEAWNKAMDRKLARAQGAMSLKGMPKATKIAAPGSAELWHTGTSGASGSSSSGGPAAGPSGAGAQGRQAPSGPVDID